MGLEIGKSAPLFSLTDKDGNTFNLSDSTADFTIVYFYPKDSTPGCTIEARVFNKDLKKFSKLNAEIIGISGGDEKSKAKFCERNKLKLTLLSDTDFSVAKKYGAYGQKSFMGRKFDGIFRYTFVLNSARKVIKIFDKVNPLTHSKQVLDFLNQAVKENK